MATAPTVKVDTTDPSAKVTAADKEATVGNTPSGPTVEERLAAIEEWKTSMDSRVDADEKSAGKDRTKLGKMNDALYECCRASGVPYER